MRVLLSLLLAVPAVVFAAQDGGFTLRVDVPLVSLDVSVTDSNGKPMTTLTKDDFMIYEQGVQQEIRNFSSVTVPYNVLLLFDCSGSTKPKKDFMTAVMTGFADGLRSEDRIAIAQFGSGVNLLQDWRPRDIGSVDVQLGAFTGCNATDFYGAIHWAVGKMSDVSGRKGVLVYTDGLGPMPMRSMLVAGRRMSRPADSIDDPGFQTLLQAVRSSGVSFYFVAINTDLNAPVGSPVAILYTLQQARARMEQLADASGGRAAFPKKAEDVAPLYEQIGRELGNSYSLGYVSTNTAMGGGYRTITVRLRDRPYRRRATSLPCAAGPCCFPRRCFR